MFTFISEAQRGISIKFEKSKESHFSSVKLLHTSQTQHCKLYKTQAAEAWDHCLVFITLTRWQLAIFCEFILFNKFILATGRGGERDVSHEDVHMTGIVPSTSKERISIFGKYLKVEVFYTSLLIGPSKRKWPSKQLILRLELPELWGNEVTF